MYTRITPAKDGAQAIAYARGIEGRGHSRARRNLYVAAVNMVPDEVMSFERQMGRCWRRASYRHEVQVRRIIASFSKKELDPDDPESPLKAAAMTMDFAEKFYPNRQAAVFVQADGEGGCVHVHLIVNDCDMTDYKGCTREQQKWWYVEKNFDEVAKNYIELDYGEGKTKNKKTLYERGAGEKYKWKEDLKGRIADAMSAAVSRDDFLDRLAERGVEGTWQSSKKFGNYILYELKDLSLFEGELPKRSSYFRSKSYKLGEDFNLDKIDEVIEENKKKAEKEKEAERERQAKESSRTRVEQTGDEDDEWEPDQDGISLWEKAKARRAAASVTDTASEEDRDRTLMFAYMRAAGIYGESQERLRIGREMFENFKEEHPYDYAERIRTGNISSTSSSVDIIGTNSNMSRSDSQGVEPSSPADAGVKEGEKEKTETVREPQTVELKRETEQKPRQETGQDVSARPRSYGAASAAERARQRLIERLKKDRSGLGDISLR